jgi:hypothetical protein
MKKNIEPVLLQLTAVLQQLSAVEYNTPSSLLNNSSVGTHTRHIIELFQSLINGYSSGTINYDNRKRDKKIETDRLLAVALLNGIANEMGRPNKPLKLAGLFSEQEEEEIIIETNFYREVLYNLEHTIHHMALIRVGIQEVCSVVVPENFGVAPSTIQYKKICVQ